MEPLTTAAIAIGSIIATKALEKTGESTAKLNPSTTKPWRCIGGCLMATIPMWLVA
ncbi:MAG: hypothetical protein V7K27_15610 [Nostoc sp.]|uniref:hypothetical protein n=1 Tax=Nostoc sp. TaxID=1180 RepID=UPI002FFC25D2